MNLLMILALYLGIAFVWAAILATVTKGTRVGPAECAWCGVIWPISLPYIALGVAVAKATGRME